MNSMDKERTFMADEHSENRTFSHQTELDEVAKAASKDATETVETLKASGWAPNWHEDRE